MMMGMMECESWSQHTVADIIELMYYTCIYVHHAYTIVGAIRSMTTDIIDGNPSVAYIVYCSWFDELRGC